MDDRQLFFTLADRDFYDVPWADDTAAVAGPAPTEWLRQGEGPWVHLSPPGATLPSAGWKIHVSCTAQTFDATLRRVDEVCRRQSAAWKHLRSRDLVSAVQDKYAPRSMAGKVCTVFPRDDAELEQLIDALVAALAGMTAPPILTDVRHPDAPIGLRYGAFREAWGNDSDGLAVPVIPGTSQPDRRGQHAVDPPLPERVAAMFTPHEAQLPIRSARLIHRTATGAVYDAVLACGTRVALKEVHVGAGPEADGSTACDRLWHERDVLRRLAQVDAATPVVIDDWSTRTAAYLALQWFDGGSLAQLVSRRHPDGSPGATPAARDDFDHWLSATLVQVGEATAVLHEQGIGHGDLHPGNVMVTPAGVRLVDLERATVDGRGLGSVRAAAGYECATTDALERDRVALVRMPRLLRHPQLVSLPRRPSVECALTGGEPPAPEPVLRELVRDVASRSSPGRKDRLFPGSIEQFTTPLGGRSLLWGAAGVLQVLAAAGRPVSSAQLRWLRDVPRAQRRHQGLADGVDGIALALARLGDLDAAAALVEPEQHLTGLSWAHGLSGRAAALLEVAQLCGDQRVRRLGEECLERALLLVQTPRAEIAGLMHGDSGVALALSRAARYLPEARTDIDSSVHLLLRREAGFLQDWNGALVALPGGRLRTTLAEGSAGFAYAVATLDVDDPELVVAADRAARAIREVRSPQAGLLHGLLGESIALHARGETSEARDRFARAACLAVPTHAGWSLLGAQGLRCTDDLASGSAGLLACDQQTVPTLLCLGR